MAKKEETKSLSAEDVNPQTAPELQEIITDYYPDFLDKDDKQTSDEKKAAAYVDQRWKSMLAARSDYEEIWTQNEKNYRVEPATPESEDDVEDWRSNHTTPLTHGMVETAVAEFIDAEPGFEIASRKDSAEDNVETLKKIVEHTRYKGDYDYQKQLALRSIGIYGTAIWHEYYREDPVYIKTLKQFDEKTNKKTYEIAKVTEFNDCYGEVVSPWDFGVDEDATTMSEAKDCAYRKVYKWSDFVRGYSEYPFFEDVKPGGETSQKEPNPRPEGQNDEDEVEVIFYYNKPYDIYWIVANGTLVNNFEDSLPDDHKQLPFAEGCFIKVPGHFWGMSIAQVLAGTQAELDTNRRLRLDRSKLNVAKVFLTAAREDLSDAELAVAPGKRIQVSDPRTAVVPLEFSDTGMSSYKEEESLIEDARWATGIANNMMSVSNSNTSATESAIVKEATLKRLRASLAVNRTIFFERIGEMRMKNILQHYVDPITVNKITGDNGEEKFQGVYREISTVDEKGGVSTLTVKPEDLRGHFTYYVKPTDDIPLSRELLQQKKERLFDKIIPIPVTDPEKAIRWLFKGSNEDPDAVLLENIGEADEKLADSENARMFQGANLPPTQGAKFRHTMRHYQYITENAWQIDENVGKIISDHINGEINQASPGGTGNLVPPVGIDGQGMTSSPVAGGMPGGGDMGGGVNPNQMVGAGAEMPAAPNGAPAIAPDFSADQQLM